MYRFLLTPRWWGINVFVLLAIPFCIFMGSWQLSRFEARVQDHRAAGEQAAAARTEAARPLARLLPVSTETSGKQATATGRYGKQLLVPGRELDGERGFYVLTLLRVDGGKALPVVRGWLPGNADPAKAPAAPTGEVTVTGALQASESPGSNGVTATGGLPAGQTGAISSASLVNLVPYEVYDAWITLAKADSGMRAVPASAPQGTGLDLKAFQNLGYTGEWFVFAGFVVFMWFRLLRREAEFARDAELGLVPDHDEEEATVTEATAEAQATTEATAQTGAAEAIAQTGAAEAIAQTGATDTADAPQDAGNIPVR
ncbi:SURF1 family protein [Streptomyces olivochromogenes]|uniref:SURF1 family protein n=1 Tax=Streptomyces olivochromogenes TaxID=1963 RepID=UPI0036C086C6